MTTKVTGLALKDSGNSVKAFINWLNLGWSCGVKKNAFIAYTYLARSFWQHLSVFQNDKVRREVFLFHNQKSLANFWKWHLTICNLEFIIPLTLYFCLFVFDSNEQLSQWDSPMRVKLSVWKPCVKTLLIELLPWALLINQSKWDLWLFEGEKILLQVPSGKVIIPPNFEVTLPFTLAGRDLLNTLILKNGYYFRWFPLSSHCVSLPLSHMTRTSNNNRNSPHCLSHWVGNTTYLVAMFEKQHPKDA